MSSGLAHFNTSLVSLTSGAELSFVGATSLLFRGDVTLAELLGFQNS